MGHDDQVIPAHHKVDKGDLVWLIYLVFFLLQPLAQHSMVVWLKTGLALVVFLSLYLLYFKSCNVRFRIALLCGMAALGLVTYPGNGGGSCFLIYAGALLPFTVASLPWVLVGLLAESGLLAAEGLYFHISPYFWFSSVLLIGGIGASNVMFAQRERTDRKLQLKQEEIEALAAVAERERIARDLHDVLGHTLSVIVLKSELASRLLQRELTDRTADEDASPLQRAQTEIAEVERTARSALAEVREAIGGYRSRGLLAEIEGARRTLHSAGVTLRTDGELSPAGLTAAEETVLALALREAVTNIVRHAEATTCLLRLVRVDGLYRLSIRDNGQPKEAQEGNGLRGMRERVESLGGRLSLTREAGTCLSIELPLRTPS